MELWHYWRIIKKRLWIVILLPAMILASYLALDSESPTTFNAGMRFVVGIRPEAAGDYYQFDRYYTWLTAEYLVDDLSEVIKSRAFASDVSEIAGLSVPAGVLQAATSAGKLHRILNVSITWHDAAELERLSTAVIELLTQQPDAYFAQLSTEAAVISLIDPPQVTPIGSSLRERLDLPLRLALGLAAAIGLTFLLDYMDKTVRHRADLEALDVPILGEIPQRSGWQRFLPRRRPNL